MPTIRPAGVGATTPDALSNIKFSVVPFGGALLNSWVASVTSGDTFGISIGDRDLIVNGSECNIEVSADVIDIARDQVLFNELIGGGQLFMPVTLTTELQFLHQLRYRRP